jgi:hypothetical protein
MVDDKVCECGRRTSNTYRGKPIPATERCQQVYSWGQYVVGKWRTIYHFCEHCAVERIEAPLSSHIADCGCSVSFQWKPGRQMPGFLKEMETRINATPCKRLEIEA